MNYRPLIFRHKGELHLGNPVYTIPNFLDIEISQNNNRSTSCLISKEVCEAYEVGEHSQVVTELYDFRCPPTLTGMILMQDVLHG